MLKTPAELISQADKIWSQTTSELVIAHASMTDDRHVRCILGRGTDVSGMVRWITPAARAALKQSPNGLTVYVLIIHSAGTAVILTAATY